MLVDTIITKADYPDYIHPRSLRGVVRLATSFTSAGTVRPAGELHDIRLRPTAGFGRLRDSHDLMKLFYLTV